MNRYELTLILEGKASVAKKKKLIDKIEKIIKELRGKIVGHEDWGEKEFRYPIKKKDTGIYLFFELELESKAAKDLLPKLKLEEEILRYLLVRKD